MGRENFIFRASSRIYGQAEKNSEEIFSKVLCDQEFFQDTKKVLRGHGIEKLSTPKDRKIALDTTSALLTTAASAVDPRIAIPTLLQAMDSYYYQNNALKNKLPWLGTALKTSIHAIWKNLRSVKHTVKSNAQLIKVIKAAAAWEQLYVYDELAEIFSFEGLEIHDYRVRLLSLSDESVINEWNKFALKRGLSMRTLESSTAMIWKNLPAFLSAFRML